jgi:predicted nucleic acid-binding protein
MKFVLDSSIAAKWVIPEADTQKAIEVRDDFCHGIHELLSPDVFPLEVAHAIAKAERQGRIPQGHGATYLADVLTTLPVLHLALALLPQAYALASAARIGVYDCLYVALSEREQCDLLTADDRLIRTFPKHRIVSLARLP